MGLTIAREADDRASGFGSYTAEMTMTLRNRHGQASERAIRVSTLEVAGDGDKGLLVFDTPADVKGTAFLSFSHAVVDDDQWLYLPALSRVKRITANNRSASFMGSEFAYEDFGGMLVEEYEHTWLRDEELDGQDCFVVESRPIDLTRSGYTRLVTWYDKEAYRTRKIEFFDRKGELLKTLEVAAFELQVDRFWQPVEMTMNNHHNGKSTTLSWAEYDFTVGLTDRDFDRNSLARAH